MLCNQRSRSPTSPALPRAQIGLPSLSFSRNFFPFSRNSRHAPQSRRRSPRPAPPLNLLRSATDSYRPPPLAIPYPPPSIPGLAPPPPSPPIPIDRRPHVFRGHATVDPRRPRPRLTPILHRAPPPIPSLATPPPSSPIPIDRRPHVFRGHATADPRRPRPRRPPIPCRQAWVPVFADNAGATIHRHRIGTAPGHHHLRAAFVCEKDSKVLNT
uniref:Uncharacterized protein n=1 Tax=Oryza glumipatula TaxID=40148 RepID=A0A0E0BID0_9ORYZ